MLKKAGKRSPHDEEEIIRTARRSGIPRTRTKPSQSALVPVFERLDPLRILVFPAAQARVVAVALSSSWGP